jgi:hypothetical protein
LAEDDAASRDLALSLPTVEGAMTEPLPQLVDAKGLQTELGVTRAAAEAIMRRLPVVSIEGLRKTYVRRRDVRRYLEERTFEKSEVPA